MAAGEKTVVQNRRARHDYHVIDRYEAGIALRGTEVKSLRDAKMQLVDSYAEVKDGELWLVGAHISPYEQGTVWNHEPTRRRKLLMRKQEIVRLSVQVNEKGHTLIPLRVYFKNGRAKVEVGLCRGKQTHDKRHDIKAREAKREIDRHMKEVRR